MRASLLIASVVSLIALTSAKPSSADPITITRAQVGPQTQSTTTTTPQQGASPLPAPAQTTQTTQTTQGTPPPQPAPPPPPATQATSTTTTTAAPMAQQQQGGDYFREKKIESLPNKALLSTGSTVFLLSYVPTLVAGAVSSRDEDRSLLIPVVGPWIDLGNRDCGNNCGSGEDLARAMIVTSGIAQGAGVALALSSLLIPESTSVQERSRAAQNKKVQILPVSIGRGAGLGAVGRF